MQRKNYLKEIKCEEQKLPSGASLSDYLDALRDFLRRPKTRFDIRDRGVFLFFLIILIILLQKVVEYFSS